MSACLLQRFSRLFYIQVDVFCLANPNKIVNYVLIVRYIVRCSVHVARNKMINIIYYTFYYSLSIVKACSLVE